MKGALLSAGNTLLDWLFPRRCFGCGAVGGPWCAACEAGTAWFTERVCLTCGLPASVPGQRCGVCQQRPYAFAAARALAPYAGELRQALLAFKRQPSQALAELWAAKLAGVYSGLGWQVGLVLPVPLAAQQEARRGFNQAALLSAALASQLGLAHLPAALQRLHGGRGQHELNASQRWQNLQGTFVADSQAISGAQVLLVDDIMTTGATAHMASLALRDAGATQVYVLTVGRTLFR